MDDAHGAGVLGKNGRGSLEYGGVPRERVIQTITLSKAFGVYGGAVLASSKIQASIVARSRLFGGTTPLPLPLAHAALEAVTILETDHDLRSRLTQNTLRVKEGLRARGFPLPESPSPIIPLVPRSPKEIARLKQSLLAAKIHPPFIQYPGGPRTGYFRFVISSEHTQRQLDGLLACLAAALTKADVGAFG